MKSLKLEDLNSVESAPKDGSMFILYRKEDNLPVCVRYYQYCRVFGHEYQTEMTQTCCEDYYYEKDMWGWIECPSFDSGEPDF